MNTVNATIVAKNPILMKQTTVTGEPKKNMSLAEARSKLFSSVVSSALNKSHDHVKTVPINATTVNKGQNIPLTSASYIIEKNETIRLQIVNRKPQQMTTSVSTASTTIPSTMVQSSQKDQKSLPLLLPFPSGQITIKSNRPSEKSLTPAQVINDANAKNVAMVKARIGLVPSELLPKRGRPMIDGSSVDDAKPKFVQKKTFLELPAPTLLAVAPTTSNWKQLEQHYNKIQSTLGVGHMPKEVSAALQEFKKWVRTYVIQYVSIMIYDTSR